MSLEDHQQWLNDYTEQLKLHQQLYREANMPSINEIYPNQSSNLKAEDLKGHAVKVIIDAWEVVEFDGKNGKQPKVVLKFKDKEKGLVCNRTNARIIAEQYGDDPAGWVGKQITLYPTKVDFGGEMVDAIRVRDLVPEADPNDDIPFAFLLPLAGAGYFASQLVTTPGVV